MTTTAVKKPEWIEKLPNGWAFLPVRAILKERKEKNSELKEGNILSVMKGIGVIRYEDKGNVGNKSSERPEAYKIVRKNDLVLNSMNLSIGSVGMAREDGVTSSVYIIYQARPKIADPDFYHYLFQTTSFQRHLASYGRGIMELREAVKERDIRNQPVVVPPLETQKRIADFLDEKTEIIDELVEKKEKLIKLLREKRAALITRAVTKGLSFNAKLKPSGIDWLGNIPDGWEVKKIKHITSANKKSLSEDTTDPDYAFDYVDIGNVNSEGKILELQNYFFANAPARARRLAENGDVIISTVRTYLRSMARIENAKGLVFSTGFTILHPTKILASQLYWSMQSETFLAHVMANSTGVNYPGINEQKLSSISLPIPSKQEQKQIADFLDAETTKIDKAVMLIESQIEKLKEYRSSLIYHAVTGKIKI